MSKASENFKKYLKTYLLTFAISFLAGCGLFCLFFFLPKDSMTVVGALNASSIVGVILFSLGLLSFIANAGTFDSMSYGFYQLGSSMFGKKANKHHDFQAYKEEKIAKRKASANYFWPILISSVPFLIVTTVLLIIVETIMPDL